MKPSAHTISIMGTIANRLIVQKIIALIRNSLIEKVPRLSRLSHSSSIEILRQLR